jgi:hypothetical protein
MPATTPPPRPASRDRDRQRCYDAETVAVSGTTVDEPVGFDRLVELARHATASRLWALEACGRPVEIRRGRANSSRSTAATDTGVIRIAPRHDTISTLAHELAHIAAGRNDVGHGPRWRALHVAFLRLLAGNTPADRLAAAYRNAGLVVDDLADDGTETGPTGLAGGGTTTHGDTRTAQAARIVKLLDKARSTTPAEADALTAKAAELMARHRVDQALVDALRTGEQRARIVERRIHLASGPYVRMRVALLDAVAAAHGCTVFWKTRDDHNEVHVVGHDDDVAAAFGVHTALAGHAARELLAHTATGNTLAWRRSFMAGYAAMIRHRLTQATDDAVAASDTTNRDGPSAAVVLAARADDVRAYMRRNHPRLATVKGAPARSQTAVEAGVAAARRADLGRRRLPTPRPALRA